MAFGKKKAEETEIQVVEITQERAEVRIIGRTPIILNRMSEKVRQELLMPARKKNQAEKANTLKHNPYEEFVRSATLLPAGSPTLLAIRSTSFKGAMRSTAVDMPGASKAQIGRLTYVEGEHVGLYGVPKLFMSVVRQAGMQRTPDVRTRCIIPEWACRLVITFTRPQLNLDNVSRLIAGAGIMQGVGDWRPEKGSGNYGQFEIVGKDNEAEFNRIVKTGGYAAQQKAMDAHEPYDSETEELLSWFDSEIRRREIRVVSRG